MWVSKIVNHSWQISKQNKNNLFLDFMVFASLEKLVHIKMYEKDFTFKCISLDLCLLKVSSNPSHYTVIKENPPQISKMLLKKNTIQRKYHWQS